MLIARLSCILFGFIMLISNSNVEAQVCVVDGIQDITTRSLSYRVKFANGDTERRRVEYDVRIYLRRCEIGSASPVDNRFCIWDHTVYADRKVYILSRSGEPAHLNNRDRKIVIDQSQRRPSTDVRFDGSEQNCSSQRINAEAIDEEKRQIGRDYISSIISDDRDRLENEERSGATDFSSIEW